MKIDWIGEPKTSAGGKTFREVCLDGKKVAAFGEYTLKALERLQKGDEVEAEIAQDKYLNKIRKAGSSGGGSPQNSGRSYQPDPEKNLAVYTKYALDVYLSGKVKSHQEAVDMAFGVRELVKRKWSEVANVGAKNDAEEIQRKAIQKLLSEASIEYSNMWEDFINRRIRAKGGYDALVADLKACIDGIKVVQMAPEGVPIFMTVD